MTTFAGYSATTKTLSNGELRTLAVHRDAGLFRPLEGDERERLRASMRSGYDDAHPLIVWNKTGEIVDGRNRRDLAAELQHRDVPVAYVDFPDETAVRAYIVAQNLARRHLDRREQRALAGKLVVNGESTRQAAKKAGVSEATARRAAADARAGASGDAPAAERVTGADGKSYPATKAKRKPKQTEAEKRFDMIDRANRAMRTWQETLNSLLVGCVVVGKDSKRHLMRVDVHGIGFDGEGSGRAYVYGDLLYGDETEDLYVGQITAVEKVHEPEAPVA